MALPVTISGSVMPQRNSYTPPFLSGGNVYLVLLESTGGTPEVWKATDPTSSFTAQDTANNPTTAPNSMWAYQDGTTLHIASHDIDGDAGNGEVLYHSFSMSSDTWTVVDQTIEIGIKGTTAGSAQVSIAIRSDGDRIVLYGGDPDADMGTNFDRIDYARWEGVSWTAGVDVGGTSPVAEHRRGASVVRGTSDGMHFFWQNVTAGSLHGATLNSSNSLSSTQTNAASIADSERHLCNGVTFDDGGTQRVVFPFKSTALADDLLVWRLVESSGNLSSVGNTQVNDTLDLGLFAQNPIASAALNGTTVHILWADETDNDLYRDSAATPQTSWGTDIEFLDAVNILQVHCNIYDRSGTKLAMIYNNGGVGNQYNEISLAVGRPPLVKLPRHAVTRAAFY